MCWSKSVVSFAIVHVLLLALARCGSCTLLPLPRCTGIDEPRAQEQQVSTLDQQCTSRLAFTTCQYNCAPTKVSLLGDFANLPGSTTSLGIVSARSLHLEPVCLSWVTVRGSARVITVDRQRQKSDHQCEYWLRLYDSQAIGLDVGLNDLTMINSDVGYINLPRLKELYIYNSSVSSIDHVELHLYPGIIDNSHIKDIFFVNVTAEAFTIRRTKVDTIGPGSIHVNGTTLILENSYITTIDTRGITVRSGVLSIKNTVIEHIAPWAFATEDTKVMLKNVTIVRMESPAFIFGSGSEVEMVDVTVDGETMTKYSRYVLFQENMEKISNNSQSNLYINGFENEFCEFNDNELFCNYTEVKQDIGFESNSLPLQGPITIVGASTLDAVGDFSCTNMTLSNCTGRYLSNRGVTCPSGGSLTLISSTNVVIMSHYMQNLTAVSSNIKNLYSTSASKFEMINSEADSVYSLQIRRTTLLKRSTIRNFVSTESLGQVFISDSKIESVSDWKINHMDEASTLTNTTISNLIHTKSIHVIAGHLVLNNVTLAGQTAMGCIYLEPQATLELADVTVADEMFAIVSVSSEGQVKIRSSSSTPVISTASLIHVRPQPMEEEAAKSGTVALADYRQAGCTGNRTVLLCDYTRTDGVEVRLDTHAPEVWVSGAANVRVEPRDSQIVSLADVGHARLSLPIQYSDWLHPFIHLILRNSTLDSLSHSVKSLTLTSSEVNVISLGMETPIIFLNSLDSEIQSLVIRCEKCIIKRNALGNILHLAGDDIVLQNSTVAALSERGLIVIGESTVQNTHFDSIEKQGIVVKNKLLLENVSIGMAGENAITVLDKGTIKMRNVVILQSDSIHLFLMKGKHLELSNVTIWGTTFNSVQEFISYISQHLSEEEVHISFSGLFFDDHSGNDHSESAARGGWSSFSSGGQGSSLWVGIALGAVSTLVAVLASIGVIRTIRRRSATSPARMSWKSSSETVHYSSMTTAGSSSGSQLGATTAYAALDMQDTEPEVHEPENTEQDATEQTRLVNGMNT